MTTHTWKEMLAKASAMSAEELTEDVLLELAEGLVIDSALLAPYIQFQESGYCRNVLYRDEKFEAICLCWEPGQGTMIHSHGRSFGVVCVYEGALTVDQFKRLDDGTVEGHAELAPVARLKVPAGGITLDRVGGIHRIFNRPDASRRAVSLHFYAGPLDTMESFEPANQAVKIVPMQGEPMAYLEPGADIMAAMI